MTEEEYRELLEQATLIDDLTKQPGWGAFTDFLINKTLPSRRIITSGSCRTMEEYRETAGFIKGIEWALSAPDHALSLVETAKDLIEPSREENVS